MRNVMCLITVALLITGCVSSGPAISKSDFGNLEINVTSSDQKQLPAAELYLDGLFVGNLSSRLPVIHARKRERTVRVVCPGYKTYEKTITVLGDHNHQVMNVILEKE